MKKHETTVQTEKHAINNFTRSPTRINDKKKRLFL